MNDFGEKVRQATKEVAAKRKPAQITKLRKDGTPRKKTIPKSAWKPGQSGNPDNLWKPGVSPNPGGRPSMKPITDALRAHGAMPYAGKEAKYKGLTNAQVLAVKQFDLVIETGDMRAAVEIMDRIEGKTVQVQQHQGPGGGAIPFTSLNPEENEKRIAELEALARGEDPLPL